MLGDNNATVTYEGKAYKNGESFEGKKLKKSELLASSVDGKFAVVNIDGTTIYVSYFDNATKFYTMQGGHG